MHTDLQMRTLDRLPVSTRRIATVAAEQTRTFDQVERARIAMDNPALTKSQRVAFLALWYLILDPARIPTTELLELIHPNDNRGAAVDISCAAVALHGIFNIRCGGGVGVSVWSHLWPWVYFVHTHWEFLEGRFPGPLGTQKDFYIGYMLCIRSLHGHSETVELMTSTPSFWATVVRGWSFLTRVDRPVDREAILDGVVQYLPEADITEHPERLDEMNEEAGGTMDDIGALIMDCIRTVFRLGETSGSRNTFVDVYVNSLIFFISDVNNHYAEGNDKWPIDCPGPLTASLVHRGFAAELVSAILAILNLQEPGMEQTIQICMNLLRYLIGHSALNLWLAETLQRGFLRALVLMAIKCALHGWTRVRDHVDFFLGLGISASLVHYRAVVALKSALPLVNDLVSTSTFRRSEKLSEQWKRFAQCTNDNLEALDEFSLSFVAYKACDNTECRNINPVPAMAGRCSGCLAFYYCSRECQRIDWEYRHRTCCSKQELLLLTARSSGMDHRERWYIRALVHYRYMKYQPLICAEQVKVLASCDSAYASRCILFTLFDHVPAPPVVKVYKIDPTTPTRVEPELPPYSMLETHSAEWRDLISRVDTPADRGFIQLHGIRLVDRHDGHVFVVPLRTDSTALYKGLISLAERVRGGELTQEEVMVEVDSMLAENADIVEVH